jgi:hypothetical protein
MTLTNVILELNMICRWCETEHDNPAGITNCLYFDAPVDGFFNHREYQSKFQSIFNVVRGQWDQTIIGILDTL